MLLAFTADVYLPDMCSSSVLRPHAGFSLVSSVACLLFVSAIRGTHAAWAKNQHDENCDEFPLCLASSL